MGALHEGHLSLMRAAKAECDTTIASIFVNPTQFGPQEDFTNYPRTEQEDIELARSAGVDYLFMPTIEEMYENTNTLVHVSGVSELWEGQRRPGHFDGVATIVAKLFHIISPHYSYFGLKDFQQCAVLKAMVRDLNFRITLRFMETVREVDGLAMSSRNRYLSPEERSRAPLLYKSLGHAALEIAALLTDSAGSIENILAKQVSSLASNGFSVDYFELVDAESLEPTRKASGPRRLLAAAKLGSTRLIDNCGIG